VAGRSTPSRPSTCAPIRRPLFLRHLARALDNNLQSGSSRLVSGSDTGTVDVSAGIVSSAARATRSGRRRPQAATIIRGAGRQARSTPRREELEAFPPYGNSPATLWPVPGDLGRRPSTPSSGRRPAELKEAFRIVARF
jgi:hypothetical protein